MLWHALLIFSVAWPGLRAVVHAHDQYAGQPNSCQALAEHISRYHSDDSAKAGLARAGLGCLEGSFFQWHVHWTMVGLTATLPSEPGAGATTISAHQPPSTGFGIGPSPTAFLPLLPATAAPTLSVTLQTFSRTAQAPSLVERVRFCVWIC